MPASVPTLPSTAAPHRNVELKGHDPDPAATLAAALALGAIDHGVLRQRDTYFAVRSGRLKLREQEPGGTQLIAYERADHARARQSAYHLVDVSEPAALTAALDAALGVTVVVEKTRRLLVDDGVRIHLDDVAGLGAWVELEAVAAPGSDLVAEHVKSRGCGRRSASPTAGWSQRGTPPCCCLPVGAADADPAPSRGPARGREGRGWHPHACPGGRLRAGGLPERLGCAGSAR